MRILLYPLTAIAPMSAPANARREREPAVRGATSTEHGSQSAETLSQALPAPDDPVVVTARRIPARAEIRALTRSITPYAPSNEPMARFRDPVCFVGAGLDRAVLEDIGKRLALDAELAGLKVAGKVYKPNVGVFFIEKIDEEITALAKRKSWVFGERLPSEIRAIVHGTGPVRAWSNTDILSIDGDQTGSGKMLRVAGGTTLASPIRKDVPASIVFIERSALP